jgi:hypothetical protein
MVNLGREGREEQVLRGKVGKMIDICVAPCWTIADQIKI